MPEMLGCTFDVRSAKFTNFVDNSEKIRMFDKMDARMTMNRHWLANPDEELLLLSLHVSYHAKRSKLMIFDLTLDIEFNMLAPNGGPEQLQRSVIFVAHGFNRG